MHQTLLPRLCAKLLISSTKAQQSDNAWQVRPRSIGRAAIATNLTMSWPASFPGRVDWLRSCVRPPIVFSLLPTERMMNSAIANRNGGAGIEKKKTRSDVSGSGDAADNHRVIEVNNYVFDY